MQKFISAFSCSVNCTCSVFSYFCCPSDFDLFLLDDARCPLFGENVLKTIGQRLASKKFAKRDEHSLRIIDRVEHSLRIMEHFQE